MIKNFEIKTKILESLKELLRPLVKKIRVAKVLSQQKQALKRIKTKPKLKVVFILVYEAMWKYDYLYLMMQNNPRFETQIVVCPFKTYGAEIMLDEMERAYGNMKKDGYRVIKALKEDATWLDIKKELKPDMVFFTSPWNHTLKPYLIHNFLDTLTCYVPYGFNPTFLDRVHYQMSMQDYAWKVFTETTFHQSRAEKFSLQKGANFVLTGFPGIDELIDQNYKPKKVWKSQKVQKKRIIWAPHHSIPIQQRAIDYSTFLDYAHFMLELADIYKDKIQICFKPHPNLKGKLYESDSWGKERTDLYYLQWQNLSNGQVSEGEYIDLFLGSDALIHDSGSFVFEYLFTGKPVMFLIENKEVIEQFNDLGKVALTKMHIGHNFEEVVRFLEEVVFMDKDDYKEAREAFVREKLMPPNHKLASENIFEYLLDQMSWQASK